MCYNVPFMFLSFFLAPFVLSLSLIQNGDSANGEHALKSRGSTVVRYSSRVYAREDNALPFPSSSLNKKYSAVQINQSKVARARVLGHATIDHVYLDGRVLRKVGNKLAAGHFTLHNGLVVPAKTVDLRRKNGMTEHFNGRPSRLRL